MSEQEQQQPNSPLRSESESISPDTGILRKRNREASQPEQQHENASTRSTLRSPRVPRGGKSKSIANKRSKAWTIFQICKDNPERSECIYCGKMYAASSKSSGTSNMLKHMNVCDKYLKVLNADSEKQKFLRKQGGRGGVDGDLAMRGCFNQDAFRKALVKMIVIDDLPFSFVDHEGFRHFCNIAVPRFDIPSHRTIARDIMQLYLDEKAKLKSIFSAENQRVSLTTDIWTSIQNISYMVVTGHFIDREWCLHRRILSFSPITNHRGETIGKLLETCLDDWGIQRVFTVTVDNASANDIALQYLMRKMKTWKYDSLVLNGEYLHVRCCAHILNLIVSDGLKELHDSIIAIRNAVKYVRSSPARLASFKRSAKVEKLDDKGSVSLDVPTRWNSTYIMLGNALCFKKAFDRMNDEDELYEQYFRDEENGKTRIGPPTIVDWEIAQNFASFLHTFFDVANKFSTSTTVTSNVAFNEICKVHCTLDSLTDTNDPFYANVCTAMRTKFSKYWDSSMTMNKMLIIATVLDPCRKMNFAGICFGFFYPNDNAKVEEMKRTIRELLIKLYDMYNCWYGKHGLCVGVSNCTDSRPLGVDSSNDMTSTRGCGSISLDDDNDMDETPRFTFSVQNPVDPFATYLEGQDDDLEGSTEVDLYLMEKCEPGRNPNFNILTWWKLNAPKYPILAQLARDVFAMPVSTVASEFVISTSGRVLDAFRSSLTTKMAEALICTQNWIRSTLLMDKGNKIEAMMLETEFYEKLEAEFHDMLHSDHASTNEV